VERHGEDPDRVTRLLCSFGEWLRVGEVSKDDRFKVLVAEPGVPVASQPSKVGSPHRVGLADQAELPADDVTGCCGDRGSVHEALIRLADRAAVSDDATAVEHAAEQVGHVPYLLLSLGPGQLERLSRDPGHPDVPVGLDDVMALQP
jgi:hypothetical protein